ncbi:MAG: RluA family pseudouridine synthase, partial [Deltaproteobacteria bacterium]|nr:RluA family pseudouridine synthase [Deltaproteobacteria bacterium]
MTVLQFIIDESDADQRLDSALAAVAGITRSQARRWIDADRVRVNACACRASQSVRLGDAIDAEPPELVKSSLEPEAIDLEILYEDDDLIVIDKPAGMVVHPAPGHSSGTLVHALLHHCDNLAGIGGVERPGIVHRLDRGTSGVLVAAKCDEAHRRLAEQFHDHTIDRVYRAVVRGMPGADEGRVDRPIGRHPKDRKRMSVRGSAPREARTAWRVARRFPNSQRAALEIFPETGRTHQIRVHLASIGLPIVGDSVYGRSRGRGVELERPALHAAALGFAHPRSGKPMRFEVPLPADLTALLARLERREG